ncbi:DNA translocase FtsK [Streptococcus chenjunshii]|uniref:DNA translocase FtsK n=1 Tax=Streptococcus chenjunshii TaxID=2173853 RepID=A0A372KM71_9STRE|nr:DNA translocase FtsK [Streptococcus chenjunshii]AXQ79147.1 DNA translocase FtsK [Streptococcus chenjunshii]RFU50981.1 DNA translocase FtsK [Streptococcus chenjunshii]RFU53373.1 DNA translocase FtsK [Streptococcus chenjunshii]
MAKAKNRKKGRSGKRLTKAEKERRKAIKRMAVSVLTALILFFAVIRLGFFGITVYNLVRVFVGSLAYLVIFAILIYLFAFKWLKKFEGLAGGFVVTLIGLLLEWHAYLFSLAAYREKPVFETTINLLLKEVLNAQVKQFTGGGLIGAVLYKPVAFLFSNIGSFLIGALFIILGLFLMSPWDIYDITDFFKKSLQKWQSRHERKKQERFLKREERKAAERELAEKEASEALQAALENETAQGVSPPAYPEEPEIIAYDNGYGADLFETAPIPESSAFDLDQLADGDNHRQTLSAEEADAGDEAVEVDFTPKAPLVYKLPSIELFAPDKPKNQTKEKTLVRKNIRILEETFASFGIKVSVERAEIGPSVTKYEVKPAVGVRVNRIANLADDLALALAAKDVRIEAPIPGKSLVGIEVPNSEIATVSFRELWEQADTNPENLLEVPLGKAVNGAARSFDLTRMPHLLVAGSTGSGKSVAVNGIIASILMKARPDQVKFMMIDPKMVELSVYNDIPHLLIPVVTNPRKASKALQKVVDEMENRYELFSHFGVRNIGSYNAKVEAHNAKSAEKEIPLPLIVVIVDELADLMMVASKEVEDAIIRLGQKARAAGIHMILATQRPSVDVISGLIKANVPSRIAFAVSSGTDSRTILDANGAEKLLGRGDMLFSPIGENHPVRLQGSFISDDDVERIVSFVKDQAEADYDDSFDPGEVSEADDFSEDKDDQGDPLFAQAKALVLETQKASASMLQRRLSVGFNRATRLMDELEEAGVIGPAEGTKPRKVLMTNQ